MRFRLQLQSLRPVYELAIFWRCYGVRLLSRSRSQRPAKLNGGRSHGTPNSRLLSPPFSS